MLGDGDMVMMMVGSSRVMEMSYGSFASNLNPRLVIVGVDEDAKKTKEINQDSDGRLGDDLGG